MTEQRSDETRRLLLYALAAHVAGDFLLQTDWMVANKFESPEVRALHVLIYTLAFVPVVLASGWTRRQAASFLGILWVTHFLIDSQRWTSVAPVWFDQALHGFALAVAFLVTVRIVGRDGNRE